jgi:hypothetical protein
LNTICLKILRCFHFVERFCCFHIGFLKIFTVDLKLIVRVWTQIYCNGIIIS